MSNAHSEYTDSLGRKIRLSLDIDLKSRTIHELSFKGDASLIESYQKEFLELKSLLLNRNLTLEEALNLNRAELQNEVLTQNGVKALSSLSLWLLHKAIDEYLGEARTLSEQNDLLCLCYGIGKKDLKQQILKRTDFDLPQLISETLATSACGRCRGLVSKEILSIREEHGLIIGLEHSQTRVGKDGRWVKIKDMYPAELLIVLDELKLKWMKREGIDQEYTIEIQKIEGYHLWLSVHQENGDSDERFQKILDTLSEYWKSEFGALFFLHLF